MGKIQETVVSIFGILYCLLFCAGFYAFVYLVIAKGSQFRSLWEAVLLLPLLLGVFSGYWILRRQFKVWNMVLIVISLLLTLLYIFCTLCVFPKILN